jgi:hypothetical protein
MVAKILDFATGVPACIGRDAMYAVVFGFSQQMFTRLVDQRQHAGSGRGPAQGASGNRDGPRRVTVPTDRADRPGRQTGPTDRADTIGLGAGGPRHVILCTALWKRRAQLLAPVDKHDKSCGQPKESCLYWPNTLCDLPLWQ